MDWLTNFLEGDTLVPRWILGLLAVAAYFLSEEIGFRRGQRFREREAAKAAPAGRAQPSASIIDERQ